MQVGSDDCRCSQCKKKKVLDFSILEQAKPETALCVQFVYLPIETLTTPPMTPPPPYGEQRSTVSHLGAVTTCTRPRQEFECGLDAVGAGTLAHCACLGSCIDHAADF